MPLFEKGALVEPRLIAIFSRRSFATVSARSVKSPQPRVGDVVAFDAVAKQKKKKCQTGASDLSGYAVIVSRVSVTLNAPGRNRFGVTGPKSCEAAGCAETTGMSVPSAWRSFLLLLRAFCCRIFSHAFLSLVRSLLTSLLLLSSSAPKSGKRDDVEKGTTRKPTKKCALILRAVFFAERGVNGKQRVQLLRFGHDSCQPSATARCPSLLNF